MSHLEHLDLNKGAVKNYVNHLDNKIDYAKWKQNLVLKYNYMPLETIKERLQNQKKVYIQKLQEGEKKLIKTINNEQVQEQVEYFKELEEKSLQEIEQIQDKIQLIRMDLKVLQAQVETKRQSLKAAIQQNVDLGKAIMKKNSQVQTIQPATARKTTSIAQTTSRKLTIRSKTAPKSFNFKQIPLKSGQNINETYRQCVESIIKSVRKMNTSEDVQTGIYFDIMNRKMQQRPASYSVKSKICDVLMDRFKDLRSQKPKSQQDFVMSRQTFVKLNWKQIMGIVLVKDRNGQNLKQLF